MDEACSFQLEMEYLVRPGDTLERIAAAHDCTVGEVMKLNRMATRMVFQDQKILVPVPLSDDVFDSASGGPATSTPRSEASVPINPFISPAGNGTLIRGPGGAVPSRGSLAKTQSAPAGPRSETMDVVDTDCLQRFIKMKVKQVTESDGTVSGTLLVTPNCLMFDPDVTHPLVKENGSDLYGMVANMEEILSVSVYREISALLGDTGEKKKDIFDPSHVRTKKPEDQLDENKENSEEVPPEDPSQPVSVKFGITSPDMDSEGEAETGSSLSPKPLGSLSGSGELPSIVEEARDTPGEAQGERKRAVSDGADQDSLSVHSNPSGDLRSQTELNPEAADGRKSPFGSARARSVGGTVASGAQTVAHATVHGTKSVAHGVVTHTKSAADAVEKGVTTTAKVVANGTKAAADVVVSMPSNIVSMGSSLVNDGMAGVNQMCDSMFAPEQEERSPARMKREQSLATLEGLKQRTQQARDVSVAKAKQGTLFTCATSSEEMPDLFAPVDEMIPRTASESDHTSDGSPVLPYYMAVRLTRKKRRPHRDTSRSSSVSYNGYSIDDEYSAFGNKLKREFWFAVPPSQADNIYHFLLQWSPDKYGQDTTLSTLDESTSSSVQIPNKDDKGFIVLDSEADESLTGDKPAPLFGNSLLNRQWEIVTVEEMCKRLSLDHLDIQDMPIPEGASTSVILDEIMIRQIMEILPARAEGYPWVPIYNSEKHGFSLSTLYRKMAEFDEDMSPVLLIVRDTRERVFGAVVSSAIRPTDHFFGTGDSCLLWRFTGEAPHTRELRHYDWTGENQFFVHAQKDCMSIGAGHGHNGLWLDHDLNHGRTQRCDTFNNEPLTGDSEDFIVQFIEAYGFRF